MFFLYLLLFSLSVQAQLKVALIDTGLDLTDKRFTSILCKEGHKDFTNTGLDDNEGHGTFMAGLIKKNAKDSDYCLIIIKWFNTFKKPNSSRWKEIVAYATSLNPNIINMSFEGPRFSKNEENAIKNHPNIVFVAAAGNDGQNLDIPDNYVFPACYNIPNIIVVGNGTQEIRSSTSNYGKIVKVWINGDNIISTVPGGFNDIYSGTSISTAIETGRLIYEFSKY